LKDIEEGHLLIENLVNIFFVTSLSVSLHNHSQVAKYDAFENVKDYRKLKVVSTNP
jgi:hypothetical protein